MVKTWSSRFLFLTASVVVLVGVGCQTRPAESVVATATPASTAPVEEETAEPSRPVAPVVVTEAAPAPLPSHAPASPAPAAQQTAPTPVRTEPRAAGLAGDATLMVTSEPRGATVVVDGRPVGPAPISIRVPVTDRGYMSRPVSVKVRFLAANNGQESHTTELMLTPLDRVPTRLDFTPHGARRTFAALK